MLSFKAIGVLSRQEINLQFELAEKKGIYFTFPDQSCISADIDNILGAMRNTMLGNDKNAICFVEHLLAAIHLNKIDNINICINGSEIPLLEGSSIEWFNLLKDWTAKNNKPELYELTEPLFIRLDSERALFAYPNEKFKMTYLFESPINQAKTWVSWSEEQDPEILASARTFAAEAEHIALGVKGKLLSYNQDGFDLPLHNADEPALHKLLDLFGDLSLCGVNPLFIKAHFISLKGSHNLNTQMAKLLKAQFRL